MRGMAHMHLDESYSTIVALPRGTWDTSKWQTNIEDASSLVTNQTMDASRKQTYPQNGLVLLLLLLKSFTSIASLGLIQPSFRGEGSLLKLSYLDCILYLAELAKACDSQMSMLPNLPNLPQPHRGRYSARVKYWSSLTSLPTIARLLLGEPQAVGRKTNLKDLPAICAISWIWV